MVGGTAVAVHRFGIEQGAYLTQGILQLVVVLAVNARPAGRRHVQAEDHAHGGGFARAIGTQEPGDHTGFYLKGEFINGADRLILFSQSFYFDHGTSVP